MSRHPVPLTTRAVDVATVAAAAAQPLLGNLAAVTDRGRTIAARSDAVRGALTPPPWAFAIWAPIFLASGTAAVRQAIGRDAGSDTTSATQVLAVLAYAGNSAWELEAQYRGLSPRSVGIIGTTLAAAAGGFVMAERRGVAPGERLTANTLAALAGWLTLATAVNVESSLNARYGRPDPNIEDQRSLALATAASGVALGLAVAGRGNRYYLSAVGWGLGTVALRAGREGRGKLAGVAVAGLAAVAVASVLARQAAGSRTRL